MKVLTYQVKFVTAYGYLNPVKIESGAAQSSIPIYMELKKILTCTLWILLERLNLAKF